MEKRAFALFAVAIMLAAAFVGVSFIGSSMLDDDSSAAQHGTESSPLSSLSLDGYDCARDSNKHYYVFMGSSVDIVCTGDGGGEEEFGYNIRGVTSGYGLTYDDSYYDDGVAGEGRVSGTIAKTGTIYVQYDGWDYNSNPDTFSGSITIHAVAKNTWDGSTSYTKQMSCGNNSTININTGATRNDIISCTDCHGTAEYSWNTVPSGVTVTPINAQGGWEVHIVGTFSTAGTYVLTVTCPEDCGDTTITYNVTAPVTNYTVSFSKSGSSYGTISKTSVTVQSGTTYTVSGDTITFSDGQSVTATPKANTSTYTYGFSGWSPTGSGTITAAKTFTATFTRSTLYTVTFDANGGSCSTSSLKGNSSSPITLPSASRSSSTEGSSTSSPWYVTTTTYSFAGWYTSATGGTRVGGAGDSYSPTTTKTLYAHFNESSTTTYYYKIVYNMNGGSGTITDTTGNSSSTTKSLVLRSGVPTYSGYTFKGWSTTQYAPGTGTADYAKGSTHEFGYGQTTLYAVWESNAQTYYSKLYYNANGGTGAPSTQTISGSYTSNPGNYSHTVSSTVPTYSGRTFLGWSTSSTATSPTYAAGDSVSVPYSTSSSAGTTLYAVWQENTLTINPISKQYGIVGTPLSITASSVASPNTTVSYSKSNASSGLTVSINGSNVQCSTSSPGTYTFTLTASATGYPSSSTTVTVQFVPQLAWNNTPSAGQLAS